MPAHPPPPGPAPLGVVFFSLLSVLLLGGCQGIPQARSGQPRIEVEVAVSLDPTFAAALDGVDAAFQQAVADQVMTKADVGLRFYPVLAKDYKSGQARPPYLLTVALGPLDLTPDQETKKGAEGSKTSLWIGRVRCGAATTLEKRRDDAPPLVVDQARADADFRLPQPTAPLEDGMVTKVKVPPPAAPAEPAGGEGAAAPPPAPAGPISVARAELLRAVDNAVRDALKEMITAIDRELALQSAAPARTTASR